VRLIDSHTHLDDAQYNEDRAAVIERARAAGVPCGLRQWPSLPHDWQLMRILPEAAESIEIAADFLKGAVTAGAKARAG